MEIPNFTRKNLYFINDMELRDILDKRLLEIDKVFLIQGNLSTILLSISIIEGIFDHVAKVFKDDIKKLQLFNKIKSANKKKNPKWNFDKLTIEEQYKLIKKILKLPAIKHLDKMFHLFRDYRNFVHPEKEKKLKWPISLSQAQMASGLLNTTIEQLSYYLFIEKQIFSVKAGYPDYYESRKGKVLNFQLDPNRANRLNSFVLISEPIKKFVKLTFELNMQPSSIFNFVFNYRNEGDFKMLRLDNRDDDNPHYVNSILYCTQKQYWHQHLKSKIEKPPPEPALVNLEIDFDKNLFNFSVNKQKYTFTDRAGNDVELHSLIEPRLQIGFFNEIGSVEIKDLEIIR